MTQPFLFPPAAALAAIGDRAGIQRFEYVIRHGSMKAGLYAPQNRDEQGPHKQDELYVILTGSGTFAKAGVEVPFGPGDLIFVEAGAEHRFVDFSEDFTCWALFWGPDGGEVAG
ncbi:cupin domain-containing protein [Niveispirillum sp.]|uniref:cupin domain-containing protein n=1 Tax=Niveispirillum sp. TaxID=1917217 RepID=UPI001B46588E|nr:cupin domain-containing protein [Niveispirillum sp.]MBP7335391.1 cupin domain-containing protein [Niveispirillum sp.]